MISVCSFSYTISHTWKDVDRPGKLVMSEPISRNTSNGSTSSSLSLLVNREPASSSDDESAPYVVSKHRSTAAAGSSNAGARASSVVSLSSSSLTDPDDLEITTGSFANGSRAKSNTSITSHAASTGPESEEEEDDGDSLIEINQDGSEKPLAKIKKLLAHPPREPKHRWETAVSTRPDFTRMSRMRPNALLCQSTSTPS